MQLRLLKSRAFTARFAQDAKVAKRYLFQVSGYFLRHAPAGGHPGLSAHCFLDSADTSLRVLLSQE